MAVTVRLTNEPKSFLLITNAPILAVLNLVFHGIGMAAIYKGYQVLA